MGVGAHMGYALDLTHLEWYVISASVVGGMLVVVVERMFWCAVEQVMEWHVSAVLSCTLLRSRVRCC